MARNISPKEGWLGLTDEVVEIPLLLPSWQVSALERAAHARGLTAAAMVRHLLSTFIDRLPRRDGPLPDPCDGR